MDPTLGEIRFFAGSFAPRGWALCNGATLPIQQYTALFAIIGTNYGGDGRVTFRLPDLIGKAVIGNGQGPGLSSYSLGQNVGLNGVTLNINEMPQHTHAPVISKQPTFNVSDANSTVNAAIAGSAIATPGKQIDANTFVGSIGYSSAAPSVALNSQTIGSATGTISNAGSGGSQAHENRQPSLALVPIICTNGVFPQRN